MKVHGLADKVKYEIKIDWLRMDIRGYHNVLKVSRIKGL